MAEVILYILDTRIFDGGGIYLVKKVMNGNIVKWRLPSGWKRAGESSEQAIVRITQEHVGIAFSPNVFHLTEPMKHKPHVTLVVYGISVPSHSLPLKLGPVENIREWKCFTAGELIDELIRKDRRGHTEIDHDTLETLLAYINVIFKPDPVQSEKSEVPA